MRSPCFMSFTRHVFTGSCLWFGWLQLVLAAPAGCEDAELWSLEDLCPRITSPTLLPTPLTPSGTVCKRMFSDPPHFPFVSRLFTTILSLLPLVQISRKGSGVWCHCVYDKMSLFFSSSHWARIWLHSLSSTVPSSVLTPSDLNLNHTHQHTRQPVKMHFLSFQCYSLHLAVTITTSQVCTQTISPNTSILLLNILIWSDQTVSVVVWLERVQFTLSFFNAASV